MSGLTLVRGARQLLTLLGPTGPRRGTAMDEVGIITDGALLIRDGLIDEVGPSRRVENLSVARDADEVIDATRCVVMPAFIDQLSFQPAAEGETEEHALLNAPVTRLQSRSRRLLAGLARHGTATSGMECGFGLAENLELKALRAAAGLNEGPVRVLPVFAPRQAPDWLDATALQRLRQRELMHMLSLPCDPGLRNLELLAVARRRGFATQLRPGDDCRTSSPDCDSMAPDDDATLPDAAFSRAVIVTGADRRDSLRWIRAGAAVALASRFEPWKPGTFSMQTMIWLACKRLGFSVEEAITAVTLNAAYALGLGAETGSLERGKRADLVVLDIPDYHALSTTMGVNSVLLTLRRGRAIWRASELE